MAALRAARASELEGSRASERVRSKAALVENAASNKPALLEALEMALEVARADLAQRYSCEIDRLKAEAEGSAKGAAESAEDVARLRAEVTALTSVVRRSARGQQGSSQHRQRQWQWQWQWRVLPRRALCCRNCSCCSSCLLIAGGQSARAAHFSAGHQQRPEQGDAADQGVCQRQPQ